MSIQLSNKYNPTQPTHIYVDAAIFNNDGNAPANPAVFNYTEYRNNPFLACPENYFMTIARFELQTPLLPVFIPQIAIRASNTLNSVNQTVYRVSMSYVVGGNTIRFSQPVIYVNDDLTQTAPASVADLNATSLTGRYYHIYSYQRWVAMVNTAFQSCYTGLAAAVVAAGGAMPTTNAPFMEFDPNTLCAILNADNAGYACAQDGSGSLIKVYFNTPLYTLYNNFPLRKLSVNSSTFNDVQLIFYNQLNTNLYTVTTVVGPPATTYSAIQIYQEGQTAALLNPIESVVFSSALIPVVPEQVGLTRLINDPQALLNSGNNSNIAPIITDFQVPFSALNTYKPDIQYTPSGEYRMIDLIGSSPCSGLDITCSWKDRYGIFHPFLLGSGCSGNLKILFRRRDYNQAKLFGGI